MVNQTTRTPHKRPTMIPGCAYYFPAAYHSCVLHRVNDVVVHLVIYSVHCNREQKIYDPR